MTPKCDAADNGCLCDRPADWWTLLDLEGDRFVLYFCEKHVERAYKAEPKVKLVRMERVAGSRTS